jgi:hypothetical protein
VGRGIAAAIHRVGLDKVVFEAPSQQNGGRGNDKQVGVGVNNQR